MPAILANPSELSREPDVTPFMDRESQIQIWRQAPGQSWTGRIYILHKATNRCCSFEMTPASYLFAIVAILSAEFAYHAAAGPLDPIALFMRRSNDASYSEAYVATMTPNKFSVDHQAVLRGLNSVKNGLGRLATFDTNEYAHFDNPLQLGFVRPPTLPFMSLLRSKEQPETNHESFSGEGESSGHARFDFWIPL